MANSESEDFESADEGTSKMQENGNQYHQVSSESISAAGKMSSPDLVSTAKDAPQSDCEGYASVRSVAPKLDGAAAVNSQNFQKPLDRPLGAVSLPTPVNPESLGAKPKQLLRTKSKSQSKHRAHKDTMEADSVMPNNNYPNNQDANQRRKHSPNKLGVKISATSILPSEIARPNNNEFQEKSEPTQSGNSSANNSENQDLHDSIQPLLDKLASLDVVEPSDEVTDNVNNSSSGGWGAWSSWMMSGASSVSSHVTQGLSTMTSVIESGLGAVDPEEMARLSLEASKSTTSKDQNLDGSKSEATSDEASSSLDVVGNVLKFVESTGEKIVSTGLNTLESIGKKTMDVLQDGDPGLKKKRALFFREPNKPTLSQILKEARIRAEIEDRERAQAKKATQAHFETLFDDYRGLVHLEALEMLSNTCQLKMEAKLLELSGTPLVEFQRTLIQIKEQCEIPDDDDDDEDEDSGSIEILERELTAAMKGLVVPVSHAKLIKVSEDTDTWLATIRCMHDEDTPNENDEWLDEDDGPEETDPQTQLRDVHEQAIRALAKFTAAVAEHFHKTAELLLIKEEHNSVLECQCIVIMTSILCSRVSSVAARYSELLSAQANQLDSAQVDHNDVNLLITNVFLEASNSSSYIQDASLLLIPVIQLGAVQ